MVANAGGSSPQVPMAQVTDEAFERVLAANTKATFLVLLAAEVPGGGFTVNMVSAGPTDTGLLDSFPAEVNATLAMASPFGRLGTADDCACVVAFLASDGARWLSGQVLVANEAASA